ncbi:hypothetical protein NEDG_01780 [Nematocida displodere]|uniref:Uncharacterized protein n=1 Tax=Nematocida displodere TaxID=1805483 RepID=A0A177EJJ0_9MICR|nr:hypothetical protein NEDG_01780 [Nematocida displodere]
MVSSGTPFIPHPRTRPNSNRTHASPGHSIDTKFSEMTEHDIDCWLEKIDHHLLHTSHKIACMRRATPSQGYAARPGMVPPTTNPKPEHRYQDSWECLGLHRPMHPNINPNYPNTDHSPRALQRLKPLPAWLEHSPKQSPHQQIYNFARKQGREITFAEFQEHIDLEEAHEKEAALPLGIDQISSPGTKTRRKLQARKKKAFCHVHGPVRHTTEECPSRAAQELAIIDTLRAEDIERMGVQELRLGRFGMQALDIFHDPLMLKDGSGLGAFTPAEDRGATGSIDFLELLFD